MIEKNKNHKSLPALPSRPVSHYSFCRLMPPFRVDSHICSRLAIAAIGRSHMRRVNNIVLRHGWSVPLAKNSQHSQCDSSESKCDDGVFFFVRK